MLPIAGAWLLLLAASPAVEAQVARTPVERICRALVPGDKHYPQYRSCCDIDGSNSRWVKADGSEETRVFRCALMGVTPGPAKLNLPPSQRPVDRKLSARGLPTGRYACHPGGMEIMVDIQTGGRYRAADGSTGRFELAERSRDETGAYARYRIAGGSFDGFFFLHRDNGQLQLGRVGWTRCEPR